MFIQRYKVIIVTTSSLYINKIISVSSGFFNSCWRTSQMSGLPVPNYNRLVLRNGV